MEAQKEEHKPTKRFIIPSQEPETAPVRSLFQTSAVVQPSSTVTGGSYADYIFKKEGTVPGRKPQSVKQPSGQEQKPLNSSSEQKSQASGVPQSLKENLGVGQRPTGKNGDNGREQKTENGKEDLIEVTSSTAGLPAIPPLKPVGGRNCIVVSTRQRGNPLLKHVRNIPWEFGDIMPDYVLGETCCAFFLSLRYHNLNPEYIHTRLKPLGQAYALRILLVQVDVKDPQFSLKELAKICILSDLTLILSWSSEEAARYLETYKCYEQKPADALKEKTESDFMSRMTDCFTTVKSVNKTDSCTLLNTFGTLSDLANASREDLSLCPGLGPQKAKRLFDTLHEPFLKAKK
ncbi:DNA excision repair protein ERCC-1 [Hyperolius riggenbachi]|uniref:DNA excision repair protein ERCC-1 n=1 Tax=Hyperolius riggenbachi TaxID=752182 RepID=UPI0035A39BC5